MNAKIKYKLENIPHPFDQKARKQGTMAWCLIKVVEPEIQGIANSTYEPVAIFNFNSEAELFMAHIFAEGLDKKLVEIDRDHRELFDLQTKNRAAGIVPAIYR